MSPSSYKTPEEHISDIKRDVFAAVDKNLKVNLYLEDWSNGMKESKDYVFMLLEALEDMPIERFMLPDTLGILTPLQTYDYVKQTVAHTKKPVDFHAHNDYDLAVANRWLQWKPEQMVCIRRSTDSESGPETQRCHPSLARLTTTSVKGRTR